MSLLWVKYGCNSCEIKVFSGQPSIVYFIRVCKMGPFRVCSLNCSKRLLLKGRSKITKFTWWIRLFSSNSGFEFLTYARLMASETNIVFPGEYFKSNSYLCKRRKNFPIRSGQLTMNLRKIDFNDWWSLITVNLHP